MSRFFKRKPKLKTKEEISQTYSEVCYKMGDAIMQIERLNNLIKTYKVKADMLVEEMKSIRIKESLESNKANTGEKVIPLTSKHPQEDKTISPQTPHDPGSN